MSFLKGLFTPTAPSTTAPTANPTGQPSVDVRDGNQPEGNNANIPNPTNAPNPVGEFNPLDALTVLRQNTTQSSDTPPSLQFSPEQLTEAASKLDFNKLIPQDAMAKLQEGLAQGDLSALPEVLAGAMRNSWQMGIQHNTSLVDKYVGDRLDHERKASATSVRENVLTSQLKTIQGLHPEAKQMFVATAKSLSARYPEATPEQIESEVWTIMNSFRSELDVEGKQRQQASLAKETDWDKYLDQK